LQDPDGQQAFALLFVRQRTGRVSQRWRLAVRFAAACRAASASRKPFAIGAQ